MPSRCCPPLRVLLFSIFLFLPSLAIPSLAQDNLHLHMRLAGRVYQDDKVRVVAPAGWSIAIDQARDGTYQGAILRRGQYVLRLCTGCAQAGGALSGRFGEVAPSIQPWFRVDTSGLALPCGERQTEKISKQINRVDLWYQRDPAHLYNEGDNDCREPKTTDSVWYGSYFAERCPDSSKKALACGGYHLHRSWLTGHREDTSNEMLFAMTYQTTDLDQLPRRNSLWLKEVLREAGDIVTSIRLTKSP